MEAKEPVILAVVVDAPRERWLLAAVRLDGAADPLLRSEDGDLADCRSLGFDDQTAFLRHRLCGVLQRGHDRLWPVGRKACQFAIVFAGTLPGTTAELAPRVAENLADWLLSPPVIVLGSDLGRLAGGIRPDLEDALRTGLRAVLAAAADPAVWEVSTRKGTWRPAG